MRTRRSTSAPNGVEQAPDLAIPALAENDLKPCGTPAGTEYTGRPRDETLTVEHHAGLQPLQHCLIRQTVDLDVVDLLDVRRGIQHTLRPACVVDHEQQAFARFVEPSHGRNERKIEPFKAVVHGRPLVRIVTGRDQSSRFVQHQVHLALGHDRLAIDGDAGACRIDTGCRVTDNPTVDAHASLRDQGFGLHTGAKSKL
jgi:hypothetical protein